ncbi:DUF2628 domain-containing protein [Pseudomonas sp. RP23018S]|uniref:DUF2628 domain-containing protein n=1 Tax=Pseudomonas sp. RP23018S TaxID=3096037 RepID=UPI002ACA6A88|nr:DUF2628 domain-containing protein [Pseudomonas sp. RP23018S]MDZ5604738.1 DUF2628 domain-containing protein [Pseudomonas sp. RP23018S]
MNTTENEAPTHVFHSLKWIERFAFFDQHGSPQTPEFKAALDKLPSNKQQLIRINISAFFFGPIYLLILGMWRKFIGILAINFVLTLIVACMELALGPTGIFELILCIGLINAIVFSTSTNYGCYLTRIKGSKSWNPYEGMRWFS